MVSLRPDFRRTPCAAFAEVNPILWDRTFPARVFLVDLKTGARQPWTTLLPPDSAGVLYGNIVMTPDGKSSVCRYRRV